MTILCVSGRAQAGKTTFSNYLITALKEVTGNDYILMNYADSLKKLIMDEFGLSYYQVYGEGKEIPDHRYPKRKPLLVRSFENYEDGKLYEEKDLYWTAREMMQFIGTDCFRYINNNHWVDSLFRRIKREKIENVIIADCRFPNEIGAVIDRGGYYIRITRPGFVGTSSNEHASETALSFDGSKTQTVFEPDFRISNDGTLRNLKTTAQSTAVIIKHLIENSFFTGGKDEYNN